MNLNSDARKAIIVESKRAVSEMLRHASDTGAEIDPLSAVILSICPQT